MQEVQESAALQLKMAFDDAKIKIKGTKGGKLVIDKKDKKKVEKVIAKQMKKPSDAKRVLGSQIVFEDVELDEKATAYPATVDTLKMIVKDKQNQTVMFDKGKAIVDLFTASAMMAVYNALKQPALKKKFEDMIKSKEGFMKTQAFAMKMAEEVEIEGKTDIYGFKNYPKRNKVGDEIEKIASKGGKDEFNLSKVASELQKGRIPHKVIKKLSPKSKKAVHAIWKILDGKEYQE